MHTFLPVEWNKGTKYSDIGCCVGTFDIQHYKIPCVLSSYCLAVIDFYLISHNSKVISKLPSSKLFERKEFALIHFHINSTYFDLEKSPKKILQWLVNKIMFLLNKQIMSLRFLSIDNYHS